MPTASCVEGPWSRSRVRAILKLLVTISISYLRLLGSLPIGEFARGQALTRNQKIRDCVVFLNT